MFLVEMLGDLHRPFDVLRIMIGASDDDQIFEATGDK